MVSEDGELSPEGTENAEQLLQARRFGSGHTIPDSQGESEDENTGVKANENQSQNADKNPASHRVKHGRVRKKLRMTEDNESGYVDLTTPKYYDEEQKPVRQKAPDYRRYIPRNKKQQRFFSNCLNSARAMYMCCAPSRLPEPPETDPEDSYLHQWRFLQECYAEAGGQGTLPALKPTSVHPKNWNIKDRDISIATACFLLYQKTTDTNTASKLPYTLQHLNIDLYQVEYPHPNSNSNQKILLPRTSTRAMSDIKAGKRDRDPKDEPEVDESKRYKVEEENKEGNLNPYNRSSSTSSASDDGEDLETLAAEAVRTRERYEAIIARQRQRRASYATSSQQPAGGIQPIGLRVAGDDPRMRDYSTSGEYQPNPASFTFAPLEYDAPTNTAAAAYLPPDPPYLHHAHPLTFLASPDLPSPSPLPKGHTTGTVSLDITANNHTFNEGDPFHSQLLHNPGQRNGIIVRHGHGYQQKRFHPYARPEQATNMPPPASSHDNFLHNAFTANVDQPLGHGTNDRASVPPPVGRNQQRKQDAIARGKELGSDNKLKGDIKYDENGTLLAYIDKEWIKAIYHNDRRARLLEIEDMNGAYKYPPTQGADPTDRMAFHEHYININMNSRLDRSEILYWWNPPTTRPAPAATPGYLLDPDFGSILLDINNHPIKAFTELPKVISGQVSGMWIELWRRLNPNICLPDIYARTPKTTTVRYGLRPHNLSIQAFGNRARRDRIVLGTRAWIEREGSDPIQARLKSVMPNRVLRQLEEYGSTSLWRDLTCEEVDAIVAVNRGVGTAMLRAGNKRLDEETKRERDAGKEAHNAAVLKRLLDEKKREDEKDMATSNGQTNIVVVKDEPMSMKTQPQNMRP
ncbi:MAG: hypothetical protein Q9218_007865 [Villophora microphyllina]